MADKEFDFNKIISVNAEGDRATTLQIGVWGGNASLTVFSNKQIAAKFALHRDCITQMEDKLTEFLTAPPGAKVSIFFTKYDFDSKKSSNLGTMVIGKDDKQMFYFGVQAVGQPGMKFVLKSPPSFDLADPMTDQAKSLLAARSVINKLHLDIPMAITLTMHKREAGAGFGGGNRSAAGGARSTGGDDIF